GQNDHLAHKKLRSERYRSVTSQKAHGRLSICPFNDSRYETDAVRHKMDTLTGASVSKGEGASVENVIRAAIALVGTLFAAFSSFLLNIGPPTDSGAFSFGVGLASVVICILVLIVWGFVRLTQHWRYWGHAAYAAGILFGIIAVISGFVYFNQLESWT